MGPPLYMPPEQYLGSVPDARSDQFSFCTALYSALYGRRPFDWSRPPTRLWLTADALDEDVDPDALAETGFALAQALWRTGGDRARAVRVATQARDRFAQVGKQPRVAAVEAWLKEHPLSGSGGR